MRTPSTGPLAPWNWALSGVLIGAAFALVCFAPARWLAQAVQSASQNRLQLVDAQGSVWTGNAQLVLGAGIGTQDTARLPGRVHWSLRPALNGAQLTVRADCCMDSAWTWAALPGFTGLQLRSLDANAAPSRWPSAVLAGLGTPWNTLQLQGTLALTTQGLVLQQQAGRWEMQGSLQLDAQHMSTSLSTLKPVGSYRLSLNGGPTPTLDLSTLDGSLQLQGAGRWVGGRLQFTGEARATPDRTEALANLLNIIGRRDGARSIIKVG
ncbi:MAG: type II secretion system protein N [Rhodoferax sp.]|nr:type II secretion system protein N [Rhodoferax sp.]